jgi:hypothetical protein
MKMAEEYNVKILIIRKVMQTIAEYSYDYIISISGLKAIS